MGPAPEQMLAPGAAGDTQATYGSEEHLRHTSGQTGVNMSQSASATEPVAPGGAGVSGFGTHSLGGNPLNSPRQRALDPRPRPGPYPRSGTDELINPVQSPPLSPLSNSQVPTNPASPRALLDDVALADPSTREKPEADLSTVTEKCASPNWERTQTGEPRSGESPVRAASHVGRFARRVAQKVMVTPDENEENDRAIHARLSRVWKTSGLAGEDGEMDLQEFRALYRIIYPDRQMDEKAWIETQQMFTEVDTDHSGSIDLEEILEYLDTERAEQKKIADLRPRSVKEWIWACVGSDDLTRALSRHRDRKLLCMVNLFKAMAQCVILLSVVVLVVDSLPSRQQKGPNGEWKEGGDEQSKQIETACIVLFTVELIAYTTTFPHTWRVFFTSAETFINTVSVVPFYLDELITRLGGQEGDLGNTLVALRLVRLLRVMRILRSLKLGSGRFTKMPSLVEGLWRANSSLQMLLILILIVSLLSATLMNWSEHSDAYFNFTTYQWIRNAESSYSDAGQVIKFQSVPDAMWWGLGTVCANAYGDIYPVTDIGRAIAVLTFFASIIILAYPIAILQGVFTKMAEDDMHKAWRAELKKNWYKGLMQYFSDQEQFLREVEELEKTGMLPEGGASIAMSAAAGKRLSRTPQLQPSGGHNHALAESMAFTVVNTNEREVQLTPLGKSIEPFGRTLRRPTIDNREVLAPRSPRSEAPPFRVPRSSTWTADTSAANDAYQADCHALPVRRRESLFSHFSRHIASTTACAAYSTAGQAASGLSAPSRARMKSPQNTSIFSAAGISYGSGLALPRSPKALHPQTTMPQSGFAHARAKSCGAAPHLQATLSPHLQAALNSNFGRRSAGTNDAASSPTLNPRRPSAGSSSTHRQTIDDPSTGEPDGSREPHSAFSAACTAHERDRSAGTQPRAGTWPGHMDPWPTGVDEVLGAVAALRGDVMGAVGELRERIDSVADAVHRLRWPRIAADAHAGGDWPCSRVALPREAMFDGGSLTSPEVEMGRRRSAGSTGPVPPGAARRQSSLRTSTFGALPGEGKTTSSSQRTPRTDAAAAAAVAELLHDAGVPQYHPLFIEQGLDSVALVAGATDADFDTVHCKPVHRRRILAAARKRASSGQQRHVRQNSFDSSSDGQPAPPSPPASAEVAAPRAQEPSPNLGGTVAQEPGKDARSAAAAADHPRLTHAAAQAHASFRTDTTQSFATMATMATTLRSGLSDPSDTVHSAPAPGGAAERGGAARPARHTSGGGGGGAASLPPQPQPQGTQVRRRREDGGASPGKADAGLRPPGVTKTGVP